MFNKSLKENLQRKSFKIRDRVNPKKRSGLLGFIWTSAPSDKIPVGVGVSYSSSFGFRVASKVESIVGSAVGSAFGSAVGSAFGSAVGSIGLEVTLTQM